MAATPTVEELLAARDAELVTQLADWEKGFFVLPDDMALDDSLRQAAAHIAAEHLAHSRNLWPQWIAQERAASGDPDLHGNALSWPLYLRALNEMAIWSVESASAEQDDAWLRAALAPMACRWLHPPYFARRVAMIQAAPTDSRAALLAGEQALLSRWGTQRQKSLPARPPAAELEAADQAITRLRAGLAITAEPMTPYLAAQVFDRGRKPGRSDRWEQCAKSQWWLASQLASGKVDRLAALTLWRYSTMFDVQELIPASALQATAAPRADDNRPAYPVAATYFNVEGVTTVQVDAEVQGRRPKARVVARKLTVPGVRDNPPVAFETLLDPAALELAEKNLRKAKDGAAFKFDAVWRLE